MCDRRDKEMSRFFVSPLNIGEEFIKIDSKEDVRHIVKALRLSQGSKVDISDGERWEYATEIVAINENEIKVKILDKQAFSRESGLDITLYQGVPKQSKMETIVQKCVEMGITRITPMFTARTIVTDNGNFHKKIDRWQKISAEAVKQCRRGIIPEITREKSFAEVLKSLTEHDMILFPYENEEDRTLKDALQGCTTHPGSIALIIGPEGGFSQEEAESLIAGGADCVTLGKTILRTETAGMTALAMIMYEYTL